jgi:DNA-binding transcriptional MerR regulator
VESFTTFEIEKKLGIPRNRLQQWLDRGVVTPSIKQARGLGTKNRFSRHDLYRLELFQRLMRCGLSRHEASGYSDISFEDVSESGSKYLVVKREILDDAAGVLSSKSSLQSAPPRMELDGDTLGLVINLLSIKQMVDRKLA